jgi:hypothetical protein
MTMSTGGVGRNEGVKREGTRGGSARLTRGTKIVLVEDTRMRRIQRAREGEEAATTMTATAITSRIALVGSAGPCLRAGAETAATTAGGARAGAALARRTRSTSAEGCDVDGSNPSGTSSPRRW